MPGAAEQRAALIEPAAVDTQAECAMNKLLCLRLLRGRFLELLLGKFDGSLTRELSLGSCVRSPSQCNL